MKSSFWLALSLALVMIFTIAIWHPAAADGPEHDVSQDEGRTVGLMSTGVECLTVEAGSLHRVSSTVHLEWAGQVEKAFLVLRASGSEGGHSLYVNGQPVGRAPSRPGEIPCQADSETRAFAPIDAISIPPEILVRGENIITLTNDANVDDDWTAVNLYLEIHGVLSGPPVALLENPSLATTSSPLITAQGQGIETMAVVTDSVMLTSSYDGIQQVMWYQIPASYTGTPGDPSSGSPTPLLIGTHGWGATGDSMFTLFGAEANSRGWLLAAPDMHGRYYTNHGMYALAWPGAQQDIIDTIVYMMANYNVDTSRIYIAGGSMGGQAAAVMAAKYPDIFAAAGPWKPITDLSDMLDLPVGSYGWIIQTIMKETHPSCDLGPDPNTYSDDVPFGCGQPTYSPGVLFEYQRRSAVEMPQNSRLIPITLWHDEIDQLVVVAHSQKLKAALDIWKSTPVLFHRVNTGGLCTDGYNHCYNPPPVIRNFSITIDEDGQTVSNLFDFLASHTQSSSPPSTVKIRTDESKPYYWLNVVQSGGDHWTEIDVSYTSQIVSATISDTNSLTLAFNLGSTSLPGSAGVLQPGMGLSENTTYLVEESGYSSYQQAYTSGYFTITLNNTGQFTLSISAISGGSGTSQIYLPIVVKNN